MIKANTFYDYVWSPVEGCLQGCWYCYARTDMEKIGKDFDRPLFYKYRLKEPFDIKQPQRIFATHYGDLFGDWIPDKWINQVLDVCRETKHTYIFITKNPARYLDFEFPDNCLLGVTIESCDQWGRADIMKLVKGHKMCSIEPIMGDFTGKDFSQFDMVVIGRMLFYDSEFDPEWVRSVKHHNIHYKANVRGYAKV